MSTTFIISAVMAGLIATVVVRYIAKQRRLAEMRRQLEEINRLAQAVIDNTIALKVTAEGDTYYAYEIDTGAFAMQGRDLDRLVEAFKARYPKKICLLFPETEDIAAKLGII